LLRTGAGVGAPGAQRPEAPVTLDGMASARSVVRPSAGLILTGGGARAAYQVGVLKAIARLRRDTRQPYTNPFPVIAGTSAGAINAAALACHADHFDRAVARIAKVWADFSADQVYRADSLGVIRSGARWLTLWSLGWLIARWHRVHPRSLLDNSPLHTLLERMVDLQRLPQVMAQGHLQALAISASSYSSGLHVTFYDAVRDLQPWTRSQRIAVRSRLTPAHLLASAAIPFVFPAVPLELQGRCEYFGDGSMRQTAPISPAVHLGAERVLVIGAGRMHEPPGPRGTCADYPSIAQVAGHALSNIFLDALATDVERLQRLNTILALLPPEVRQHSALRPIEVLVIAPSQRIDEIAARHIGSLPPTVRALLRGVGVTGAQPGQEARGAALASYLLFEASYTRELMALGEADTFARRDEVIRFFGWDGHAPRRQRRSAAARAELTGDLEAA
jgi:NTE family protein